MLTNKRNEIHTEPYSRCASIKILEQPVSKGIRFRYECEGRSAGSIPGANSTSENKTFPEIQVVGYQGKAVVVVSCVTKDEPYMVHPCNLVGKNGCANGVCTLLIPTETMRAQFPNVGIQSVKRRDIQASLRRREKIKVDPFRQGYNYKKLPSPIDLGAIRLCFQVFLEGEKEGKYTIPVRPVVSDIIYDKKASSDLTITKLSDCFSYVDGGKKDIIILCEKVLRDDIEVHLYEERQGKRVWQAKAYLEPSQVHKQSAIWIRTPRYHTYDVSEPVKVYIQLYRPSDRRTSEPLPFELLPLDSAAIKEKDTKRKKAKMDSSILGHLNEHVNSTLLYGPMSPYADIYAANNATNAPNPVSQHDGLATSPLVESVSYHYRQQKYLNIVTQKQTDHKWNLKDQHACPTWNIPFDAKAVQPTSSTWNIPLNPRVLQPTYSSWNTSSNPNENLGNQPTNTANNFNFDNYKINNCGDLQNTLCDINTYVDQLPDINSLSLSDIDLNLTTENLSESLKKFIAETASNHAK